MAAEETGPSQKTQSNPSKTTTHISLATDSILSPGFRSVAALAGWDEESLLAGLVVEDTPERDTKHKKRSIFPLKTPPTDSRRKRRARKSGAVSIPVVVLSLDDDDETAKEGPGGVEEKKEELLESENGEEKAENDSSKALPCMDQLREELSCAICLEICFEPSTTPCGHSFCMKCLKYSATKCGKRCPKCRQMISNGRACTVNTVLWNTIQLLFPKDVDARKAAGPSSRRSDPQSPGTGDGSSGRRRSRTSSTTNRNSSFIMSSELVDMAEAQRSTRSESFRNLRSGTQISRAVESNRSTTRTVRPSQSEDAALALRLQREEFMGSVTETRREVGDRRSSLHSARANLRAMASRAIQIRARSRY